jgi:O-antigen/teichoic acid export membrane protein
MALIFSVLAAPVVKTVYGAKWVQVIPLLPCGMAFGVAAAVSHAGYMLLLASQRPNWCLMLDGISLAATVLNLLVVLPLGLIPYLIGLVIIQTAVFLFTGVLLLRIGSIAWAGLVAAFLPSAISAAMAVGICEALAWATKLDKTIFGVALAYGVVFFVCYVFLLRALFEKHLSELVTYLPANQRIKSLLWLSRPAEV